MKLLVTRADLYIVTCQRLPSQQFYENMSVTQKLGVSLLSNTAMGVGCKVNLNWNLEFFDQKLLVLSYYCIPKGNNLTKTYEILCKSLSYIFPDFRLGF